MTWTDLAALTSRLPQDTASLSDHMGWIKTLPCAVCMRTASEYFAVDAHHAGPRGLRSKVSAYQCIPLCHVDHHQEGPLSYHKLGPARFEETHRLHVPSLIAGLLEARYGDFLFLPQPSAPPPSRRSAMK